MQNRLTIELHGKKLEVIIPEDFGYYSILGTFEGMLSEFLERPQDDDEEHDG